MLWKQPDVRSCFQYIKGTKKKANHNVNMTLWKYWKTEPIPKGGMNWSKRLKTMINDFI